MFYDFLMAFLHINILLKGIYSKRKDPFSEGKQNNFECSPLKAYIFHLRMGRYTQLQFCVCVCRYTQLHFCVCVCVWGGGGGGGRGAG